MYKQTEAKNTIQSQSSNNVCDVNSIFRWINCNQREYYGGGGGGGHLTSGIIICISLVSDQYEVVG